MSTFFASDLHLGHRGVLEFEAKARPFTSVEEMNETIVERWNKAVNKRDVVWVLGDVVLAAEGFAYLERLRGIKKLVLGNHDKYPVSRYLKYFSSVHGAERYNGCILTHVPIHPDQFYRFKANIHGHLHSKVVTKGINTVTGIGEFPQQVPDARYINVSIEQNDLTPIAWEVIKARVEVIE